MINPIADTRCSVCRQESPNPPQAFTQRLVNALEVSSRTLPPFQGFVLSNDKKRQLCGHIHQC